MRFIFAYNRNLTCIFLILEIFGFLCNESFVSLPAVVRYNSDVQLKQKSGGPGGKSPRVAKPEWAWDSSDNFRTSQKDDGPSAVLREAKYDPFSTGGRN